ncbi:MAG: hypothetical protein ACI8WB_002074 [Phenylobacterium sp.]|jgi:hypothetical protein
MNKHEKNETAVQEDNLEAQGVLDAGPDHNLKEELSLRQNASLSAQKKAGHRRNIILIRPKYQNKVGLFTGLMAVLGTLIGVGSLLLLPLLVGAFSQTRTYIPTKILDTLMLSFPWLILCVGVIFAFAVFTGVYYSHRVAGPLFKIESILQQRLAGKAVGMIHLRPGDQLNDLAKLLNDIIQADVRIEGGAQDVEQVLDEVLKDISKPNERGTIEMSPAQFMLLSDSHRHLKEALHRQPINVKEGSEE